MAWGSRGKHSRKLSPNWSSFWSCDLAICNSSCVFQLHTYTRHGIQGKKQSHIHTDIAHCYIWYCPPAIGRVVTSAPGRIEQSPPAKASIQQHSFVLVHLIFPKPLPISVDRKDKSSLRPCFEGCHKAPCSSHSFLIYTWGCWVSGPKPRTTHDNFSKLSSYCFHTYKQKPARLRTVWSASSI